MPSLPTEFQDKVLLAFVSSLMGLIPLIINLVVNAVDKKSQTSRRNSQIQYLNSRIDLLSKWFHFQKEIVGAEQTGDYKETVKEELAEIFEEYNSAVLEVDKQSAIRKELYDRVKRTGPLKRAFLLYAPYNMRGWIFHTAYYMTALPFLVGTTFFLFDYFSSDITISELPVAVPLFAVFLGLTLLFIFWRQGRLAARATEEKMHKLESRTMPRKSITA